MIIFLTTSGWRRCFDLTGHFEVSLSLTRESPFRYLISKCYYLVNHHGHSRRESIIELPTVATISTRFYALEAECCGLSRYLVMTESREWKLHYHKLKGRGEYVRLMFEAARVPYIEINDTATNFSLVDSFALKMHDRLGSAEYPVFATPYVTGPNGFVSNFSISLAIYHEIARLKAKPSQSALVSGNYSASFLTTTTMNFTRCK